MPDWRHPQVMTQKSRILPLWGSAIVNTSDFAESEQQRAQNNRRGKQGQGWGGCAISAFIPWLDHTDMPYLQGSWETLLPVGWFLPHCLLNHSTVCRTSKHPALFRVHLLNSSWENRENMITSSLLHWWLHSWLCYLQPTNCRRTGL